MQVLISTAPFGDPDPQPRRRLEQAGIEYVVNPFNRKLTESELKNLISDAKVLIAGTEPITRDILDAAGSLKLICRVGIGLDSVDLRAARDRNIEVTYTPEAPSAAVSELTIGLMINLLRSVHRSNYELHEGAWRRYFGLRLEESVIGVIGAGRIGTRVVKHLKGFDCGRILVNDLAKDKKIEDESSCEYCDKTRIYKEADIISVHVPLTSLTQNMVGADELAMMKPTAFLVNTARGGIVNEFDLFNALTNGELAGAAIDTFEKEPYSGPLSRIANCLLTAHMGSMSYDCRIRMEIEAAEEAVRFFQGESQLQLVPEEEYENQQSSEEARRGDL